MRTTNQNVVDRATMQVYVLAIEAQDDEPITLHESEEDMWAGLHDYVQCNWRPEYGLMPDEMDDAIEAYFTHSRENRYVKVRPLGLTEGVFAAAPALLTMLRKIYHMATSDGIETWIERPADISAEIQSLLQDYNLPVDDR